MDFCRLSLVLILFIVLVKRSVPVDLEEVEYLVKKWSPLIWMSPDEKFLPLSTEDFLNHVYVADNNGKKIFHKLKENAFMENSKSMHLIPFSPLDVLKNITNSFIYGKNPNHYPVPIYAIVKQCKSYVMPYKTKINQFNDNLVYDYTNSSLYFHVSYWMFFPYNEGKEFCFLGKVPTPKILGKCIGRFRTMGNHVGDWEHMSLAFAGKKVPEKLYLSVHDAGVYYDYDERGRYFKYVNKVTRKGVAQVPKFPEILRIQGESHPVVFSAYGSHGLWASPGEYDFLRVPRLKDKNGYGIPWKTWNNIKVYHIGKSKLPYWITFAGKWGNPRKNCLLFKKLGLCEFTDGPKGILRNKQDFYC